MAKFELPTLPYSYDALEPYIDKLTMEIHHSRHHNTYVTNLNNAVKDTENEDKSFLDLFASISKLPAPIRNSGGGVYNHNFFWEVMSPNSSKTPSGALLDSINSTFKSFDDFKKLFTNAGISRFGSGWAWLVLSKGNLVISSTPNQDNPLMDVAEIQGSPLLCLDVWEHAYYLKYQNKRPDYIENWWNVVNWDKVSELYNAAK